MHFQEGGEPAVAAGASDATLQEEAVIIANIKYTQTSIYKSKPTTNRANFCSPL